VILSGVQETLQQLAQRRLREIGAPGEPISTRAAWLRAGGEGVVSYETFRRVVELRHTKIGDRVADALSVGLDVPVSTILAAAGQRPRLGRFEMPRRADRLNDVERKAILSVVDAILTASEVDRPIETRGPGLRAVAREKGDGDARRRR
jgi:hypothetical protein